jgi:hypothetical protein
LDQGLIDRMAASRVRLRALGDRLSDDELAHPLGNGWTAAAEYAHLAFWDRRATLLLDRWTREGVSPSPMDVEAMNGALLPQWLLLPPRAAVTDALAAAEEVDARIEALSDDLAASIAEGGVRLDRAHHRIAHLDELERFFR